MSVARPLAVLAAATALLAGSTQGATAADSCARSRDYILEGLAGELTRPSRTYQELFRICMETLTLPNVKDAYILKAGLIAIDPQRNTVMATASTLAQFCRRFPHASARIFTPAEQRQAKTIGLVVMMPALTTKSCQAIRSGA
jgi:hypothetical protein